MVPSPNKRREITLETARVRNLVRFEAQMPFPGHVGVIAVVLQQLGDRGHTLVEYALVTGFPHLVRSNQLAHVTQAGNMIVRPAEQHGSGDRASRAHVKVSVAHTFLGQTVQYRRVDLAPVAPQVRVAHVIGYDQQEVGAFVLLSCHAGSCKKTRNG